MSKYYESEKFKALATRWKKALKDSGFTDIEKDEDTLNNYSSIRSYNYMMHNKTLYEAKETYYRLAGQFLHEHKFKTKLEQTIWQLHSSGMSLLKIDKQLKKTKGTARNVVKKLLLIMRSRVRVEDDND